MLKQHLHWTHHQKALKHELFADGRLTLDDLQSKLITYGRITPSHDDARFPGAHVRNFQDLDSAHFSLHREVAFPPTYEFD